jgi:cell division transport system permease protein
MTSAVIAVALALPAGLHLLLGNLKQLSGGWDGAASISLFLRHEIDDRRAEALGRELEAWPQISGVRFVGRQQALEEFRELSGFGAALDALESNPLPALLVLEPAAEHRTPEPAQRLLQRLRELPETDIAQLDLQWVQRLHAITDMARRGVLVLASLLALAVLLILGNTIRLEIQNRHNEIEITRLVGATNAFIRRPFLYCGLWYGLFGGAIAWLLVTLSMWSLKGPVGRLAGLYHSDFALAVIHLQTLGVLLSAGTLLGLAGSWISVGRHLQAIEPE